MPNLHAHYYHGSVKAFRHELDGTSTAATSANSTGRGASAIGPSSASGGRSWTLSHIPSIKADPNERDALGRTVLHLAASSNTPQAYTFFTMLLRNPNIAVNLQDYENGYTALHRALYAGNIRAARDLLARSDTDVAVKDWEGLTAFDLYNGTVDGTNPPSGDVDGTDLYVWGVNRNYALGTGDSSDKAWPDRVNLLTQRQASENPDPAQRFFHIGVKDVVMSRLHTGVITTEARGNLSLCGFGSGGRLGRSCHSQMSLLPLPDLPHTILAIALGQDHTLALTSGGYILSWGNNRFAQLGYAIEAPEKPSPFAKDGDDQVQVSPKRIVGPLKKEWVRGVAAGRMSSACWTADAVWTWGTNLGHLGYEKAANPVQVNPRRVPAITQPVLGVALSDYAMLCLLDSNDVLCFHHDTHFKINFSSPQRSLKAPKNPGQVNLDPTIVKVTSCGQTFATLSKKGDVCTFQLPHPSEEASKDVRDRHVIVKPQVQWALRKSFTAVRDMALGSDGTIIICTYSGHVFVRQRVKAGAGQLKFRRIPYLQRVVKVATNESGAFAAVRIDARPSPISLAGKTLEEDMFLLQPHFRRFESQMNADDFERVHGPKTKEEDEEAETSTSVSADSTVAVAMCQIIKRWRATSGESLFAWSESLLGSNIHLVVGEYAIPAHSVIMSLRTPVLARALSGKPVEGFTKRGADLEMDACHPLVALLLLQYLYSDDVAAIWDSRVSHLLMTRFPDLQLPIADIKADLKRYAEVLELAPLVAVLAMGSKTDVPTKTLAANLAAFHAATFNPPSAKCDTIIVLADREVAVHSTLLRARCQFFESMFADRDWTLERRESENGGKVVIQMTHLRWRPMKLVFRYMHEGVEDDLFDYLHQETLDEFLDFVFEVLAAATELLMDRLVLVCSQVIARHCNPYNAAALATEASFYQASVLKRSIFDYIIACMETMLESGLLDDMDEDVLRDLTTVIASKQSDRAVIPRSGILVNDLMAKHRDWLALQDIPTPRVRVPQKWKPRSPLLGPRESGRHSPGSPLTTPDLKPLNPAAAVDEIFSMDEDSAPAPSTPQVNGSSSSSRPITPLTLASAPGASKAPVWKSKTVQAERVDLRSVMAETAAAKSPRAVVGGSPSASMSTPARRVVPGSSATSGSPLPPTAPANGSPILTPQRSVPGASSSSSSTSGWRTIEQRKTSLTAVQAQQGTSPVASSSPLSSVLNRPAGSQAGPAPARAGVITPVKLASSSTPRRSGATGPAWSTPTTYAPPPPVSPPQVQAPTQAFSLLAIQQEERDAAARMSQKTTKSFAEIQAEERDAAVAKAQEEEFMRWWQEEEARMAASGSGGASGSGSGGGGGRGRGRGQAKRVPNQNRAGAQRGKKDAEKDKSNANASTNTNGNANGSANAAPNGSHAGNASKQANGKAPANANGKAANGHGHGQSSSTGGGRGQDSAPKEGGGRTRGGRGKGRGKDGKDGKEPREPREPKAQVAQG